jgi:hypothetical protein
MTTPEQLIADAEERIRAAAAVALARLDQRDEQLDRISQATRC